MEAYMWIPVDFVFDFSGASASAGDTVQTGQSTYYYHELGGLNTPEPFRVDNESVAEISGIEIFGPYSGNRRIRLRYVKPVIDGKELDMVFLNERMAPGAIQGAPDALRMSGMRYGHAAINLGMPVLAGGDPANATPKIGPNETLSIRVALPSTTEYGDSSVSTPMVVRVWLAMVKGTGKLNAILENYHGRDRFANGELDCSMTIGDLETGDVQTFDKKVGSAGEFRLSDWTQLPGGSDADKPKVEQYITYAINRNDTTPNQWYRFTMSGNNVYHPWQQLVWNNTKREAIRLTHVGVSYESRLTYTRLYRSNRAFDLIYRTSPGRNPLPLAADLDTTVYPGGPAELTRSYLVWGENGSIEIRDNGTAIPAVSATETGVMVAVYGKKYEFV